ncbi:VOC family protein [Pseudomonas sp. CrR25]|nr:VOC family protein [Pseudomonas sp. CrR25]
MNEQRCIVVANFRRSRTWYETALAPLGYQLKTATDDGRVRMAGFGPAHGEQVLLRLISATLERRVEAQAPGHLRLHAECRESVRAFHRAALLAGGEDNGRPGVRPGQTAYAALVYDPDGYSVEVVSR